MRTFEALSLRAVSAPIRMLPLALRCSQGGEVDRRFDGSRGCREA